MADASLDDSACGEKHVDNHNQFSSSIVFTNIKQGYALLRVKLPSAFAQCSSSFIHERLRLLSETLRNEWEEDITREVKVR